MIAREDALGREQVGFLNRTVRRTRKGKAGPVEEVRRTDYLDYVSGETLEGVDAREAVTAFLAQLRGQQVTPEEMDALADATLEGADEEDLQDVVEAHAVVGDFELLGELGRGGMGVVYKARQLSVGRIVALKVLPPMLAADRVALKRFRREIQALARCDHPNVVKILTSGQDGERVFYAMEYVEGADMERLFKTLSRWCANSGELREGHLSAAASRGGQEPVEVPGEEPEDLPEVEPRTPPELSEGRSIYRRLAELFADAADGLGHLHEAGVVHRDIKPGNLMLTDDGWRVVVMDLGLAKLSDESQALTGSGVKLLGTLRYISPEQLQRKLLEVDHRTDIYGLGATLYELCTTRRFLDGDSEKRLIQQVLHEQPVLPRRARPGMPRDLATVIQVATEKQARHRYSTAVAMAEDLRAVAEHRPIKARPPGLLHCLGLWAKRSRVTVAVLVTVTALAGALGLWQWDRTRVKVRHFANTVQRLGLPEGIGEVPSFRGRHRTWRFSRRSGRIIKVELVNGSGYLVERDEGKKEIDGDASYEITYAHSGQVSEIVSRRRNGQVRRKRRLAHRGATIQGTYLDRSDLRASRDGTDVAMFRMDHDSRGYGKRIMFFNDRGSPRQNDRKAHGYTLVTDSRGLVVKQRAVSHSGQPSFTNVGVAWRTSKYDALGNVTQRWRFGPDGKLILVDGVAGRRARYDERGNQVQRSYFGTDRKPSLHKDGIAGWRARYDEQGNRVQRTFLDTGGKPAPNSDGVAGWRSKLSSTSTATRSSATIWAPAENRSCTRMGWPGGCPDTTSAATGSSEITLASAASGSWARTASQGGAQPSTSAATRLSSRTTAWTANPSWTGTASRDGEPGTTSEKTGSNVVSLAPTASLSC